MKRIVQLQPRYSGPYTSAVIRCDERHLVVSARSNIELGLSLISYRAHSDYRLVALIGGIGTKGIDVVAECIRRLNLGEKARLSETLDSLSF